MLLERKLGSVGSKIILTMKRKPSKKLGLAKIKIASLSKARQEAVKGGVATSSIKISCISQGAPICSDDSCIF
jgi:hypothetical protein